MLRQLLLCTVSTTKNLSQTQKLSSLCEPICSKNTAFTERNELTKYSPLNSGQPTILKQLIPLCKELIRNYGRDTYKPNALKRINKHGLEKRLSSRSQREILARRYVKGRWTLTAFDRFKNHLPEKKDRNSKRVQLMNKKHGYRSVVKKPEYFTFSS